MLSDAQPYTIIEGGALNRDFMVRVRFHRTINGRLSIDVGGEIYTFTPEQERELLESLRCDRECPVCGR